MRTHQAFRPSLSEILESRAVPSVSGATIPAGVLGISVTLPSQVSANSPQVQAAFAAFDASYVKAVDNILLAPGSNGVVVPSNNRAAFNASIEASLETLAQQLVLSLGTTTTTTGTTSTGSTTSTVANQVSGAIVGNSSTSLETRLLSASTSAISLSVPLITSTPAPTIQTLVPDVVNTAEQVRPTNRIPVAEGLDSPSTTLNPVSISSSSTPSTKAGQAARSAFGAFLNDYFGAVQKILLAPDATGQVNPAAHRAAFDAKVNQALQSLETQLSTTVSRYPATSGLGPQIQAAIEGNGASSLKSQLASLPTPSGTQAAVVREFTLSSTRAIAQALSLISGDIAKLIKP